MLLHAELECGTFYSETSNRPVWSPHDSICRLKSTKDLGPFCVAQPVLKALMINPTLFLKGPDWPSYSYLFQVRREEHSARDLLR